MNSPSSLSLYQIGEEFEALEHALIESGGEWTGEIEGKFLELGSLEADKIDAYAALCRSQQAYQAALKVEEETLREKRKVSERLVTQLRERLHAYMDQFGKREIKGRIWKAVVQNNGGLRTLTLLEFAEHLPPEFQVVTVEADTAKLREVIADTLGESEGPIMLTIDGHDVARLEQRTKSVRFR